jgi:ParB/RepB/Spo0J family partition protein
MPPEVVPQTPPAPSSTKSSDGSLLNPEAASAADRTFQSKPRFSLDEDLIAHGGAMQDRKRLTGAFLIELQRIRPDPLQPRRTIDDRAQFELEASIERHGILQPVTVRFIEEENVYQIISGERRYRAAVDLKLPALPCWIRTPDAKDVLVHQVIENWQRRNLEPFELRDALIQLRDSNGYSQKELSKLTGKPESEISRLLSMENLAPEVEAEARQDGKGTFTKRHLVAVAQLPTSEQFPVVQVITDRNLTAADTEKLVRETKAKRVGLKTRGAPLTQRFRYLTKNAAVTLTFRRRNPSTEDILAALDDARSQVRNNQKV